MTDERFRSTLQPPKKAGAATGGRLSFALEGVIATDELKRRFARVADATREKRALEKLVSVLAGSPRRVLQALTDVALELCQAHSAGISLLEEADGKKQFRWHAVSGRWQPLLWATLPREFSPCGTVLDRDEALLMVDPERYFTPLSTVPPRVEEVLLIPFAVHGKTVGTVWVVAHDTARKFDATDRDVVSRLARFAGIAYARLSSMSAEDARQLALMYRAGHRPTQLPSKLIQRHVLVVDDNRDVADSLATLLRQLGHRVHVAYDGPSALELARRQRPDLILLDIVLPGMSGTEVAKELRALMGSAVQIIAVSGFGNDEDLRRSSEAGFDHHLVKPVDPGFLDSLYNKP